jgi:hypothetical protein
MAENEGSSVGMVAIIAIIVLILIVGVFLYRWGGLGGGSRTNGGSINVELPGGTGGTGGGTGGGTSP